MISQIRNRLGFLNRNLQILTIKQTISSFFRKMVTPYSSLYILALGGETSQIGIVNSLNPLAGLLIFPISGYLTDRKGRVKLIATAGYLSALTMLLYLIAPSWEWIALGALLQGFMVFEYPPTSAILADSIDSSNRGTGMATITTIASVLSLFSPYIAGIILELYGNTTGIRILYGLILLTQLFNATLVLKYLEETASIVKRNEKLSPYKIIKESYIGIPKLLSIMPQSVKALGFLICLGFIANGIASPYWVVFVTEIIGLSKVNWGLILLIESFFTLVLRIPCGLIVDRFSRTKILLTAVIISLISLPSIILAKTFIQILLIRLGIGIARALFMPSASALMADYIPRDLRGKMMSAIGRGSVMIGPTGFGTGGPNMGYLFIIPLMISSIAGGVLYSMNPAYPWLCVLGIILLQLSTISLFIREPMKPEK